MKPLVESYYFVVLLFRMLNYTLFRGGFLVSYYCFMADQTRLDFEAKKLQSYVKEKSLFISEKGALADKISPGVLRSLVTLTDKSK